MDARTSTSRVQALIVAAPAARSTAAYSASVKRVLTNFVRELDISRPPRRCTASGVFVRRCLTPSPR
jgi:hypothetical protein